MGSTGIKIAAIVAALAAVLLGLLATTAYQRSARQAQTAQELIQQQKSKIPQTLAVVATKPLAAYQPIEAASVAVVPVAVAPANYFTSVEDVIKRVPLVDIDVGAPLTGRYFKEGNILARVIPPGYQAMSFEVNDVIAVGGFVRPGDIVDVLLYLRAGTGASAQARVLQEAAQVLAYQEHIIDRPEGLTTENQEARRRVRTAVIAVPEKDTTKIMLGISMGELRLSLHGQRPELADASDTAAEGAGEGAVTSAPATASTIPDKAITLEELARIKPPPKPATGPAPPPRPTVEIIRGTQAERVRTP
ncbi:MAG: Flp pilus assembly protein CpaB [Gammaproteobacteria bacterium]|jgi:pilus assembly protein CpaB